MSTAYAIPLIARTTRGPSDRAIATGITRAASKQTFYTICLLADRDRVGDAYRAYAYFRWVDDQLDQSDLGLAARMAFVEWQQTLIDRCYRNHWPERVSNEEQMLVSLIRSDTEPSSGLQMYIRYMMAVMDFDAQRRGRLVTAAALSQYTRWLAIAVTECIHHFVGHGSPSPQDEARYHAVSAAHITHMLRDTLEDVEAGYFNIPREIVEANGIDPRDVSSVPYQAWIRSRVTLARSLFEDARGYLSQVEGLRYRLAVCAYIARFEYVLDIIERDAYRLRAAYPERKSLAAAAWMGRSVLSQALSQPHPRRLSQAFFAR